MHILNNKKRLFQFIICCSVAIILTTCNSSSTDSNTSDNNITVSNANLTGLSLSSGILSPPFEKDITSYTAEVSDSIASITVIAAVEVKKATIKINNISVNSESNSQAIALAGGRNTITIEVTAEDAVSIKIYKITVKKITPILIEICDNGMDDDGDGFIDCRDSDCASLSFCLGEGGSCSDGIDNDGDSLIDCTDPDCDSASNCVKK